MNSSKKQARAISLPSAVLSRYQHNCSAQFPTAGSGGRRDFAWLAGPRDEPRAVGTVAGRLDRALKNFLETFPLFAAAILACAAAGKIGTGYTIYGSATYVIGRALYVPLYAMGTPLLRTLVWTVSILGILAILVAFFR